MSKGLRVLLGDFDRSRMEALGAALSERGLAVTRCENGADALDRCQAEAPDAAVLEVLLSRKNGFEVLKALKEDARTAGVKVILVLDEPDDYGEHRARLCGADAILRHPVSPEEVVRRIRAVVEEGSLRAAAPGGDLETLVSAMEGRARAENPLLQHITDPLTGLYNRAYMELKLAEEFKKARRFQFPLACVLLGMDAEGELAGPDHVHDSRAILNEVAGLLLCESRDIDHLGRHDAWEFSMVLPHTEAAGATTMTGRILKSIEGKGFVTGEEGRAVTASAGIAMFGGSDAESADELWLRCRAALEASRRWGGNRFTVWAADAEKASR